MGKRSTIEVAPVDPDVPKKLGARLRGVYLRVSRARSDIAHREAKNRDRKAELDGYEADPASYEAMLALFPDQVVAVPTSSDIARANDEAERAAARLEGYKQTLQVAEADMALAEAEVLAELRRLGRVTPGREPWPERPPSMDKMVKMWQKEFASIRKQDDRTQRTKAAQRERDATRREEERQQFDAEIAEIVRRRVASMPPGRAAAYLSMVEVLQEKLRCGDLTGADIYDIAAGDSPKMQGMIDEAQSRAIVNLQRGDDVT